MEDRATEGDVVDDVNALLRLGVGDSYRLEHIKQSYMRNKSVWVTDKRYLDTMREKYLVKRAEPVAEEPPEADPIHCWKCGKKTGIDANFCMACGTPLFDVGTEAQRSGRPSLPRVRIPRIAIYAAIPAVIAIAIGGAYAGGYLEFGQAVECGAGLVMDASGRCVPLADCPEGQAPDGHGGCLPTHSRCGAGLVLDEETNQCVLPPTHSKCGEGLVLDPAANQCILAP
ncbi:MAG: zinc ribbon domain-containing protein [Nitrosopumilus sp.]|nr:zinc ribbon domain-containing protein [Nitrosopumilus sp.]CAI9832690.1 conserved hypothetical protein [Nitrosopumilaceae archaeon]MDA7941469.1 zinc ribbon domain-containing protein [Nitrosopumilus sp.]MDA7943390.1 zinc ribbon domain-containing protein [Nitrosopumilus sp.]MDA7945542.1 zinc ribbon domain-containing protein [Nitrosopumilus sp.]